MTVSFSLPLSEILGLVSAGDLDTDGAVCVGAGAVKRDDEAIGCFAEEADDVLIMEELAVGRAAVVMLGKTGLVLEALTVGTPVVGGLELDDPPVDGFSVEVVVRGFTTVEVDARGLESSVTEIEVGLKAFEIESRGREVPAGFAIVLRDVVAAVLLSGAVVVCVVGVGLVVVELAALRGAAAVSVTSDTVVVRTVAFRAVVVVGVGAIDALTVVRLVPGTVFLIGASSTALAFALPATIVVALLLVVFGWGSGSDTFKTRSISFARISSSSPATSAFLPLVAVALDIVRVVRGVASSDLDADRVARRVGISITPLPLLMGSIDQVEERKEVATKRVSCIYDVVYSHIVPDESDKDQHRFQRDLYC